MLEMAELIGPAATLRLIAAFGGGDLYVPMTMPDDHPIVQAIGLSAGQKLAEFYGRERLDLPVGNQALAAAGRQPVLAQVAAGKLSRQQAARQLGTSTRYVRQLLATPRIMRTTKSGVAQRMAQLDLLTLLDPESPEK